MSLLPFRVRVTADGSGTLDGVYATVELVDRAELAADFPEPWAWYRGDDLTGYAEDEVVQDWPDRSGGMGTASHDRFAVNPTPGSYFTANAVGGHPGVRGVPISEESTQGSKSYAADVPDPIDDDGFTIAQVINFNSSDQVARIQVFDLVDLRFRQNGWAEVYGTGGEQWASFYNEIYRGSHLVVGRRRSDGLDLFADGILLGSYTGVMEPRVPSSSGLYVAAFYVNPPVRVADSMYWNRDLSDDEVAQVWAYAQDRYGL